MARSNAVGSVSTSLPHIEAGQLERILGLGGREAGAGRAETAIGGEGVVELEGTVGALLERVGVRGKVENLFRFVSVPFMPLKAWRVSSLFASFLPRGP